MPQKPELIYLNVLIATQTYSLGMLSIKTYKNELSYHFHYPLESSLLSLDINRNSLEFRSEHITWHKSVINFKRYNDSRIHQFKSNFLPLPNDIKIILVESFYLYKKSNHLLALFKDLKIINPSQTQLITKIETAIDFSLIFILIPKNFNFENYSINLSNSKLLFKFDQIFTSIGRINAFDGFDLLVCISPYVPNILNTKVNTQQRLINFEKPLSTLEDIIKHNFNLNT
ncbi:MAG: hypothetical protein P4L22_02080 [Candidatus Babeliales bacterium]|nr:hypothetical protein [Candidatus Babeliales bacterium]